MGLGFRDPGLRVQGFRVQGFAVGVQGRDRGLDPDNEIPEIPNLCPQGPNLPQQAQSGPKSSKVVTHPPETAHISLVSG